MKYLNLKTPLKSITIVGVVMSLSACFTSTEDGHDTINKTSITEVDLPAVSMGMMIEPLPFVWGQRYNLDSNDIIISGTSDRSQLEDCNDQESVDYYINYKALYSTSKEFEESITIIEDVELLNPGKIYRYENVQYVNDINRGVHMFDYTDSENPKDLGFLNLPGNIDIAIMDDVLYANTYSSLVAVDISKKGQPQVSKILKAAFKEVYKSGYPMLNEEGGIAWAWQSDTTYTCYNDQYYYGYPEAVFASDPSADQFIEDLANENANNSGQGGSMARFELHDDYLYAVDMNTLYLFSITERADPKMWTKQSLDWGVETLFREDTALFMGTQTGLRIYDISNPGSPQAAGELQHTFSCDPVVVQDGIAYVTLRGGSGCWQGENELQIIDVSDIYKPKLIDDVPMYSPHGLAVRDSLLFICEGDAGLKVFELTDGLDPQVVDHVDGFHAFDIILEDDKAYVTGDDGVRVYDISNPSKLVLLHEEKKADS